MPAAWDEPVCGLRYVQCSLPCVVAWEYTGRSAVGIESVTAKEARIDRAPEESS